MTRATRGGVAALTLVLVAAVVCADAARLRDGVWDVSVLIPGRGAVPPSHELHISAGSLALRERETVTITQWLMAAAERLGVIYGAVPQEESALCRSSATESWQWTAALDEDGLHVRCLPDWFTAAALRRFQNDGVLTMHFEATQPLLVEVDGECVATQWGVDSIVLAAVSDRTVVARAALRSAARHGEKEKTCMTHVELARRPTAAAKADTSSSSIYAPLGLLLVVIAVRLLPRYILTRTGQIDSSSFRGRQPAKLTPARRAELLQKQRRIIEQMKAEDRANSTQ